MNLERGADLRSSRLVYLITLSQSKEGQDKKRRIYHYQRLTTDPDPTSCRPGESRSCSHVCPWAAVWGTCTRWGAWEWWRNTWSTRETTGVWTNTWVREDSQNEQHHSLSGATSIRRTFKSSKNAKLFNASKEFHTSDYFHLVIFCSE